MRILGAWLAVILSAGTVAGQQGLVMIDEMTSVEVENAVKSGKTTLLLFTGGYHENRYTGKPNDVNGPTRDNTAVSKHNVIAGHLVRRIAQQLGNALALGAIPFSSFGESPGNVNEKGFTGEIGTRPAHLAFPGSAALSSKTYTALVHDVASSLIMSSGFKYVAIMGEDGGGQIGDTPPLQAAARQLAELWGPKGVKVFFVPVYERAKVECGKRIDRLEIPKEVRGAPGGCWIPIDDPAEVMVVNSSLVRKDKFAPAAARFITPAIGQELLEQKVRIAVEEIRKQVGSSSSK